jgi:putative ABC transport system permease protein
MMVSVVPRYFETLGVHLVRGRLFQEGDGEPGHEVAVINQRLGATLFSNEDPIGKGIRLIDDTRAGRQSPLATIVGVAPTIRQRSLQEAPDGTA